MIAVYIDAAVILFSGGVILYALWRTRDMPN